MEKLLDFMTHCHLVCQLKKLLYGLKQTPQLWYEKIDQFFVILGFKNYESYHSIYVLNVQGDTLVVAIYVDDLVLTRKKPNLIFRLKSSLADTFEMIDLGILHFFLGLQVL